MTWNYRMFSAGEGIFQHFYIAEVYYEDGKIVGYTDPISPIGETEDELKADIGYMMQALERPILLLSDLAVEDLPKPDFDVEVEAGRTDEVGSE